MMLVVTSATSPAQSLVLRAWTEDGHLRVQISPTETSRAAEPILVGSTEHVIEVVRAWLALDVLHDRMTCDDPSG